MGDGSARCGPSDRLHRCYTLHGEHRRHLGHYCGVERRRRRHLGDAEEFGDGDEALSDDEDEDEDEDL